MLLATLSDMSSEGIEAVARPRKRGEYAKTRARRQEILEAALQVFAASGYRNGSLREVAERVGMSEAGLLHHFPSKVALLEGVLRTRDDQSFDIVSPELLHGAALLEGLAALAEYNSTVPGIVELFCILSAEATASDHPAHEYFQERYRVTVELVERAVQEMADAGQLRGGTTPQSAARTMVALMDGLQVQWLLDRDSVDMPSEIRNYVATLTVPHVS